MARTRLLYRLVLVAACLAALWSAMPVQAHRSPSALSSRSSIARTAVAAHSSSVIDPLSSAALRHSPDAFGLALAGAGDVVGLHPKGESVKGLHAFTFAPVQPVLQPVQSSSFPKGPALEFLHLQREIPLLTRIDAPSIAPTNLIRHARTYRQAVRLALHIAQRKEPGLKPVDIARACRITRQHCTDYFIKCDKPMRRSLPAERVAEVEVRLGNSFISQWLAARAGFTVLEELQAGRAAA